MPVHCFKCKSSPGTVCSRDGAAKPYCSNCFIAFCTRVIRDNLLRHCGMPSEEPLVVAVSGGHNSMALLHQLGILRTQNRLRPSKGKVTFTLLPLHLREEELLVPSCAGHALGVTMREQFDQLEEMLRRQCGGWEFASEPLFTAEEICVVRYSDYLSLREMELLRGVLHHPRLSLTDREMIHLRLRRRVLAIAAAHCINTWKQRSTLGEMNAPHSTRTTSWHHLITGDNALRCCVTSFREMMSGAEESLLHLSGFRGFVNQCIEMRPLRTLLPREMVIYCRLQDIWAGYSPSLSTFTSLRSFNRILETFFNGLMHSYRTSIFNVLSTLTKLEAQTEPELLRVDLQCQKEGGDDAVGTKQNKRIIPCKTAQHNYERLQVTPPPRHFWFDNSPEMATGQDPWCILCGCLASGNMDRKQRGQYFLCNACVGFLEGMPSNVAQDDSMDIFATLAKQLQSLMDAADAVEGRKRERSPNAGQLARSKTEKEGIAEYILSSDDDDDVVDK